jgi:hypothetical protein
MENQTIAQKLGISFESNIPFEIEDKNGRMIYREWSDGTWIKKSYNESGLETEFETSEGYHSTYEYDEKGHVIYFEKEDKGNSYWFKREYDKDNILIYHETDEGVILDNREKGVIIDGGGMIVEIVGLIKILYGLDLSNFIKK